MSPVKRWTHEDAETLVRMILKGSGAAEIGACLKRPPTAIIHFARGLRKRGVQLPRIRNHGSGLPTIIDFEALKAIIAENEAARAMEER